MNLDCIVTSITPLINIGELAEDLRASAPWCKQYNVRGYRAPMIGISEEAYPLLKEAGFTYSSSIYAPAGVLLQKNGVWEIPVSTLSMNVNDPTYTAPRDFSSNSFSVGNFRTVPVLALECSERDILKIIERELKRGLSPVIILHPYELVKPARSARLTRDLMVNPLFLPFLHESPPSFQTLLNNFPSLRLGTYLDESLKLMGSYEAMQLPQVRLLHRSESIDLPEVAGVFSRVCRVGSHGYLLFTTFMDFPVYRIVSEITVMDGWLALVRVSILSLAIT